jgi:hypothetical protein
VRERSGALVATGEADANGAFAFVGLPPGTYTIEVVDDRGNIVGTSPAVTLLAGSAATVTVTAAAAGTIAAGSASSGGLTLFGLGTIGTVALIGGAASLGVLGYEKNKKDKDKDKDKDKSPSK